MKAREAINEIERLLCDRTIGVLLEDKLLEGDDEEFGSFVTLSHLRHKIRPLLEELRTFNP